MRIRFLNSYEPVTNFYADLIPYLVGCGHQIEIVISRAEYRHGRSESWISSDVRILRTPAFGVQANSRLRKLIVMLVYIAVGTIYTLFSPKVDVNIFLTQPPLFSIWGYVLNKLRGQRFIQVLMDIYPDVAIESGVIPPRGWLTWLLRKISRFSLRHAETVIVIGRCMEDCLRQMGVRPELITLIPNWANENSIFPLSHKDNPFRYAQGWQERFVVLYSGNMGIAHYFDDILETSLSLRDHPKILFAFIGRGERKDEIESYRNKHHLENIVILPFQEESQLTHTLTAADLHFASLRPNFEGLVVPSKVYNSMASGRPILFQGPLLSEISLMIEEHDIGTTIAVGHAEQLTHTVLKYAKQPELCLRQGNKARQIIETIYSRQVACEAYAKVVTGANSC